MAPGLKKHKERQIMIYCVKCKDKTGSKNLEKKLSKNNRLCLSGICIECNSRKNQFIPREE
jgi:hypothetical protein